MNRLDICISNDDYSVKYGCSAQSTATTGGFDRLYKRTDTKHHVVTCSTLLSEEDYQYFRAFYLDWQDDPQEFICKLIIEGTDYFGNLHQDYLCSFVKDSVSFDLSAMHFRVSFQLDVFINPMFALTSRPYPNYHKEYVATGFSTADVDEYKFTWVDTDLGDSTTTSITVHDVMMRDPSPIPHIESAEIGIYLHDVVLSSLVKPEIREKVSIGLAVNDVQYRIPVVYNFIDNIDLGLTVNNAVVEYI